MGTCLISLCDRRLSIGILKIQMHLSVCVFCLTFNIIIRVLLSVDKRSNKNDLTVFSLFEIHIEKLFNLVDLFSSLIKQQFRVHVQFRLSLISSQFTMFPGDTYYSLLPYEDRRIDVIVTRCISHASLFSLSDNIIERSIIVNSTRGTFSVWRTKRSDKRRGLKPLGFSLAGTEAYSDSFDHRRAINSRVNNIETEISRRLSDRSSLARKDLGSCSTGNRTHSRDRSILVPRSVESPEISACALLDRPNPIHSLHSRRTRVSRRLVISPLSHHRFFQPISRRSRYARNASDTSIACRVYRFSERTTRMLRRRCRQDLSSRIVSEADARDRFRASSISSWMGKMVDSARTIGASCSPTCLRNPLWTAKDAGPRLDALDPADRRPRRRRGRRREDYAIVRRYAPPQACLCHETTAPRDLGTGSIARTRTR